ncbi:MAG: isoamylase early set domain-containing protein [Gemmatimonas sp.]
MSFNSSGNDTVDAAISALRVNVPVRSEWREGLLREIAAAPQPSIHASPVAERYERAPRSFFARSFAVRPLTAIAACLLAMLSGVAGTLAVTRNAPATVSSAEASPPLVNAANTRTSDNRQIVRFALVARGAASVSLVGDFNNWDPQSTPLRMAPDGTTWFIDMPLAAGRHVYAFMVDGDIIPDPSAPRVADRDFGVQNSVILVGSL